MAAHTYASIQDAARGLLVDVAQRIGSLQTPFVVMGGWCPVLRLENPRHPHPGTKDVDVLFEDGASAGSLQQVIRHLLQHDYVLSAKHEFQLLRALNVAGREFIFNVDLLHPSEASRRPEMFVDHVALGVVDSEFGTDRCVRSIVLPSSRLIFDQKFYSDVAVHATIPSGANLSVEVPLVDASGLIISKSESVKSAKRQRDAFDLYLAFSHPTIDETCRNLKRAAALHPGVRDLLRGLADFVAIESNVFDRNSMAYFAKSVKFNSDEAAPSNLVYRRLAEVFSPKERLMLRLGQAQQILARRGGQWLESVTARGRRRSG